MNQNIFWNINKLISYNALLYFVIGERGVGKSYGAKEYVCKNFIKKVNNLSISEDIKLN